MLRVIWQAPGFGLLVVKVWNRQACLFFLPVAKMKINYQTRFVDSVSPLFAWQSGRQRIPRGSSKDGEGTPLDWERTGARSIHCTSHLDSHILETLKGIQPTSIRNFRWPVNCGLRRSSERKAQTSTSKVVATRRISNVWKSWTPSRRSLARISTRRPVQRIAFWDDSIVMPDFRASESLYTENWTHIVSKYPIIVEGSLNRNFRQYGQLKGRVEQSSQQKEDAIARKSEERRYIRAKC